MKKALLPLLWLGLGICFAIPSVFCQNNCLDFDGNGDYITHDFSSIASNPDFTVEMWFLSKETSTITNCVGNFRRLFSLYGTTSGDRFEFGECGGVLNLFWRDGFFSNLFPIPLTPNIHDNQWHCVSVIRTAATGTVEVFLDCNSIFIQTGLPNANPMDINRFRVGHWGQGSTPTDDWLGQVDDVKLWLLARPAANICANKNCILFGNEPGLELYWPLDEGLANGNNTSNTSVNDIALPAQNGTLVGFNLSGTTSNFVKSGAKLIYPNYQNLDLQISDYFSPATPISQICTGEPVHFCLKKNGQAVQLPQVIDPTSNASAAIVWQFLDNTVTNWTAITLPPFSGFCFPVMPGVITAVCTPNADGFVDRQYRAVTTVTDPVLGVSCDYISEVQTLRICCPLSPAATVTATTNFTDDLLCAGDVVNFTGLLNSPDQFVNTPGPGVTIDWTYNNSPILSAANQTSFTLNNITVTDPTACFEATVKNCAGKSVTYTKCFTVDPIPMAGSITELPTGTLTLLSNNPLAYEICPGNDAQLKMVNELTFKNGVKIWQYLFPSQGIWYDLGISNSIQNTNILPCLKPPLSPYLWPSGEKCIKYRIVVKPFSNPSGCDPKYSNELTICLKTAPAADVVTGATQICKGQTTQLTLVNYNPSYIYTWFWNGLQVGAGQSFTASKTGCYWVEISNGCQITTTVKHCLTVCEIIPVISCPLPTNDCVCEGLSIMLTGCAPNYSKDNCAGTLSYTWTWDSGTPVNQNGCNLEHIPASSGTTYTLTVTNTSTGCSATTSTFIKPCKQ